MLRFFSGQTAQLARFCIVGATIYALNILALAALCELLHMHYIAAYVLVFLAGNALGYWLNKRVTFAIRKRLDRASLLRYLLVNCAMLAVSTVLLRVFVESWHMHYLLATAIVAALNAPASFVVHRSVTYRINT